MKRMNIQSIVFLAGLLLLQACASSPPVTPDDAGDYLARARTQVENNISVTAAVPDKKETRAIFGSDLYRNGVQPVWLEITNSGDRTVTVLPAGLDPGYFSAIEAANLNLKLLPNNKSTPSIDSRFVSQSLDTAVEPGETKKGFIFSALDEGTKAFNVDILGKDLLTTFTFFIQVPGLHVDHYNVDWGELYAVDEYRDLDTQALKNYLAAQTCCTTDKKAKGDGDPVNLVVIGTPKEMYAAFIRAGWDETETITGSTSWKTMRSFIGGGEYRYSPVSGLYVFGRPQDVAFQKARGNIHERNHLRLWMSPVKYEGLPVWLGQISRDIGVRFTKKTITTHKIDPDTDETREFLLEDLAYSQALAKFAYVEGAIPAPIDQPRGNFTGDPYFTDGYRLVMWVTSTPVDTNDVEYIDWITPPEL